MKQGHCSEPLDRFGSPLTGGPEGVQALAGTHPTEINSSPTEATSGWP